MTKIRSLLSAAFLTAVCLFSALVPQTADAAAMSYYLQNKLIDFIFRAQTFSPSGTLYIALSTTTPGPGSCGTEVSGGSYARAAVVSSLTSWTSTNGTTGAVSSNNTGVGGNTSNATAGGIPFPGPTAAWGTIVGFCIFDAATSGNLYFYGTLTTSKTVNSGDAAPSFQVGALSYTLN